MEKEKLRVEQIVRKFENATGSQVVGVTEDGEGFKLTAIYGTIKVSFDFENDCAFLNHLQQIKLRV